jgi:hypothetical protein
LVGVPPYAELHAVATLPLLLLLPLAYCEAAQSLLLLLLLRWQPNLLLGRQSLLTRL